MHDYHNNTVEIKEKTVSAVGEAVKHFYLCCRLCYTVIYSVDNHLFSGRIDYYVQTGNRR